MAKKKKKNQKYRVEFRKNRENRARQNDLTREVHEEGIDETDFHTGERLSGKGDISRYRTVIGAETDDEGNILLEIDEENSLKGLVLSAVGLNSFVEAENGKRYECTIRRVVRTLARDGRNAVVTGDHVWITLEGDEHQAVIERVEPRRGTISRTSGRKEHLIVANTDQVLIVVSADDPPLKPHLIDRFLVSAEKGNVAATICINKIDLVNLEELQPILGIYGQLGYDVVLTSAEANTGIDRLRQLMKNRQTVLTGQSGVGKSSLLNALQPDWQLQTGNISSWTSKGKHTTRRAQLLKLDFGGWVVDTPGIRQLELWNVPPEEIEAYFIEFRPLVTRCKFPNCSHTHEDRCGIKDGVTHGLIHPLRYESYCKMIAPD